MDYIRAPYASISLLEAGRYRGLPLNIVLGGWYAFFSSPAVISHRDEAVWSIETVSQVFPLSEKGYEYFKCRTRTHKAV